MRIDRITESVFVRPSRPHHDPAPTAPQDDVSLQLIIATGADLQMEIDPALWTAPGAVKQHASGIREVDLGEGRTRRDYPDGRQTIDGTKRLGQPVHRVRKPDGGTSWQIDYPKVMASLQKDLAGVDRAAPETVDVAGNAQASRFPAGPNGNAYTRLDVAGRGAFHLVSDGPLSSTILTHMAAAISEAPPQAFEGVRLMFVLGELGESRDPAGRTIGTVAGFAQYQSNTLFFTRERLHDAASARETMWHEAGHLFDRANQASSTAKDDKQVPVFGYGKLIMEGPKVCVDESDFITKYASTNEQEDFAEIHRVALEERAAYNARHGEDFFTLTTAEIDRALQDKGYGDPIRRRLNTVIRIYQEEPKDPASPPA